MTESLISYKTIKLKWWAARELEESRKSPRPPEFPEPTSDECRQVDDMAEFSLKHDWSEM